MFDARNPLPPLTDGPQVAFDLIATVPATSGPNAALTRLQQVTLLPGTTDRYVALDTRGQVWLVEPDGSIADEPFLDARDDIAGFGEFAVAAGLRSLAFHPDFDAPGTEGFGKIYLAYSVEADTPRGDTRLFRADGSEALWHDVVAEVTVSDPAAPTFDPSTLRELFRVEQVLKDHNVGQLGFDPGLASGDEGYGHLYVTFGDGGGSNDPLEAAGDLSVAYGKILRIDPIVEGAAYGIPDDNPFIDQSGALPEIVAFGFRNPQSFSFFEGQMIAADIGQDTIEEINAVRLGGHHGWDDREGTFANTSGDFGPLPSFDEELGYQYPLVQYDHEEIGGNAAVAGGFVYQGTDVVALDGMYVFSDFPSGRMFAAPIDAFEAALADGVVTADETIVPLDVGIIGLDGRPTTFADVAGNDGGRVDLRFSQTAEGEILVFTKQTGEIFVLTDRLPGEIVRGTDGEDTLYGTEGADVVRGGEGDDVLYGDAPPDAAADFGDGLG